MLKTNLQYLEFQVVDHHRGNSCLALLRVAQPSRGLLVSLVSEQVTPGAGPGVSVRLGYHATGSAALAALEQNRSAWNNCFFRVDAIEASFAEATVPVLERRGEISLDRIRRRRRCEVGDDAAASEAVRGVALLDEVAEEWRAEERRVARCAVRRVRARPTPRGVRPGSQLVAVAALRCWCDHVEDL